MWVSRWFKCSLVAVGLLSAGLSASAACALSVTTTIRPLALLISDIAPPSVEVSYLVPAWADPHSFQLKPSDLALVTRADLIVWLGEELERFMMKALTKAKGADELVLTALPGLSWPAGSDADFSDDHAHHHAYRDPHIWLNPANAEVIARAVANRLRVLLPAEASVIDARLAAWLGALGEARARTEAALAPVRDASFGVTHDAYGHFADAFGLTVKAAVATVPEERLSAKKVALLQQQLTGSACLLAETDSAQMRRLAQTLKLPLVVADPLAADPAVTSYTGWLDQLTTAFVQCLQRRVE